MLCIHLKNTDPYFCLAAEEYFLKNFNEEIFMIWQSHDTVVVGKHQCAPAEINYPFVRENNITVARRISGGGTVFHDAGNVNFAIIKNVESPAEISFRKLTKPIVDSLEKLAIKAVNSGRNDLVVDGKKISGNAEHIYKNRVLHHGTLLFDSDLKNLGRAIKVVPGKYRTKAVQSNRSEVANISDFLKSKISVEDFILFLFRIQLENSESRMIKLTDSDLHQIEQLAKDKFRTWEWNFGYSPKYTFQNKTLNDGREIEVKLKIVRGVILEIKIGGDYLSEEINGQLSENLQNKKHFFDDVEIELKSLLTDVSNELVYAFF